MDKNLRGIIIGMRQQIGQKSMSCWRMKKAPTKKQHHSVADVIVLHKFEQKHAISRRLE